MALPLPSSPPPGTVFFPLLATIIVSSLVTCCHALFDLPQGDLSSVSSFGRVHMSSEFVGEAATLPCDVDFKGCGKIYFLTWSKNVSNEWQRVYLYSESYQTALGLFSDTNRIVQLDATNMTRTGAAFLKIKAVQLEDEGTYKCDVTYVHGQCPSLTYTELFTLGKCDPGHA